MGIYLKLDCIAKFRALERKKKHLGAKSFFLADRMAAYYIVYFTTIM